MGVVAGLLALLTLILLLLNLLIRSKSETYLSYKVQSLKMKKTFKFNFDEKIVSLFHFFHPEHI